MIQQQGGYGDSKYGFSSNTNGASNNGVAHTSQASHNMGPPSGEAPPYHSNPMTHSPPHSPLYGTGELFYLTIIVTLKKQ